MPRPAALFLRSLIFLHRWMGVVLAIVFALWFASGIVMMYWSYPDVSASDRLEHSPTLVPDQIKLTASEAFAKLANDAKQPDQTRLNTFNGRPVYRFRTGRSEAIIYADTGEEQVEVTRALSDQSAAQWTGQPASAAQV